MASSGDVRRILGFLDSACQGIAKTKRQRIGCHSPISLWRELTSINKAKQATGSRLLLAQKLEWFAHEKLKVEADSIRAVYAKALELLKLPSIIAVLEKQARDIHSLERRAGARLRRADNFRELVNEHEMLVQAGLKGSNIDLKELERVEFLLCHDFSDFADETAKNAFEICNQIRQWDIESQNDSSRSAMLAGIVLGIAKKP